MSIVAVKNKYHVVIPPEIRRQARVSIGDLLEAKVEEGKITLTPKTVIEEEIREGLDDLKSSRTHGPYQSADEMIRALHHAARKGGKKKTQKRR